MWKRKNYKILIVDEIKHCKKKVQKVLSQYDILTEYTGVYDMKDKIKEYQPHMILIDAEILKTEAGLIRRLVSTCSTPIVALGGTGEVALDAMFAGKRLCSQAGYGIWLQYKSFCR